MIECNPLTLKASSLNNRRSERPADMSDHHPHTHPPLRVKASFESLIAELQVEGKQQSLTAKSARAQESLIITGISPDGFAMSLSDGSVKTVPQALFDQAEKKNF